ncbi:hypothetical protein DQ239_17825 [Blastococcus sp. TF02-09]|uniref:hypothetical protein n=1 Tax=Blastococcus sp. TF02-09 TaxID=2250576 RepID=UPI000DE9022C|nr:hypothetical protein [Blastococcus sp. TF02-9]RBY75191.1 hypothetical protein DQ239_17825 [Blastococcus sp. TF02-9]
MSTTSRLRGPLAAGLLATAVLTGCGGEDPADDAAPTGAKASEASAKPEPEADLATGLLGADDFGPTAVVTAVSREELEDGAGESTALARGAEVTPAECSAAVQGTQPDFSDFEDVAAVSAVDETTATIQMLIRGGPVEGSVQQLADTAVRCSEVQVTAPSLGQVVVSGVFENLPAPDLGDDAAVVLYTTTLDLPDGTQGSMPMLLGAVEDGDRLVFLTSLPANPTGADAPLDAAAFTALLERAHETQAAALD